MSAATEGSGIPDNKNFKVLQQLLYNKEKELNRLKHDLRTPVTSIQLVAEFILQHPSDDIPEHRKKLEIIIECCRQINQQLDATPMQDFTL